jgi:hypothetical protein
MVVRPVQFLCCLSSVARRSVLTAVVGALIAAGGCARGAQPVASPQPFRDEHDPGDGFQFYESAVPTEDAKSDSAEVTSETTIEIDVDEESAESTPSDDETPDHGDDSSSDEAESGDDETPDDGDDSSGSQLPRS